MTTAFLPGVIILPARNDDRVGVAKRARDEERLPALLEEADARGWSSCVPERSLALRRRRGPASTSFPRGCGWVAFAAPTAEEHCSRREEAETPDAVVGAGAAVEETATADPPCFLACRSTHDSAAFDPPPMASSLLPLCAFIADLVKARDRNKDCAAKRARDEDLLALSEEAGAQGWSSSLLPERSLAPRRRWGPASSSTLRG